MYWRRWCDIVLKTAVSSLVVSMGLLSCLARDKAYCWNRYGVRFHDNRLLHLWSLVVFFIRCSAVLFCIFDLIHVSCCVKSPNRLFSRELSCIPTRDLRFMNPSCVELLSSRNFGLVQPLVYKWFGFASFFWQLILLVLFDISVPHSSF